VALCCSWTEWSEGSASLSMPDRRRRFAESGDPVFTCDPTRFVLERSLGWRWPDCRRGSKPASWRVTTPDQSVVCLQRKHKPGAVLCRRRTDLLHGRTAGDTRSPTPGPASPGDGRSGVLSSSFQLQWRTSLREGKPNGCLLCHAAVAAFGILRLFC